MESSREYDIDLVKFDNSDVSLIEYDDKTIDQHGNTRVIDDEDNQFADNQFAENQEESSVLNRKEEGELRQILNSLLPPKEIGENEYKQVSLKKASRSQVILLQKIWDEQLQIRQARETGICAIRESLNEEAFSELIRETTINLPERGLLCLRIRNESKMTIQTYQTLYQSSLSFGMRKCIQSQNDIGALNEEISNLKNKRNDLMNKLKQVKIEKQNYEKLCNEQNQILQKNQNQEKEFLKHQKAALQSYLKAEFGK